MEDLTETKGSGIAPMDVTETEVTEDITDPRGDMTGIIIMIGTTEKEGEEMDFSKQKRE